MIKFIIILMWSLLISLNLLAQSDLVLDESYEGMTLVSALESIESKYDVSIYFNPEWFKSTRIDSDATGKTLIEFLNKTVESIGYKAIISHNSIVFVLENPNLYLAQKKDKYGDLVTIGSSKANKGEAIFLYGKITDGTNDEGLIGARVYIKALNIGVVADFDGNYKLNVPSGRYTVDYSSVGYDVKSVKMYIQSSGTYDMPLFSGSTQLQELVVTANPDGAAVNQKVAGLQQMNSKTIKQLPTFMGEVDPVKSLTTLPGVTTAGELSSGFNVRGGESGQNLILQDGAVIYNPTHLFGFYSAFNADMINNVNLYKGGGPATYGGRVSSVLDLKLRNGDEEEFRISGGIGLVSSRLTIEGPIAKNKASFIIGGRGSYTDWLLHSFNNIELNTSSAQFYDTNAKLLYRAGEKDFITGSFYFSHDDFSLSGDASYAWNTKNYSLEWSHSYGDKLISTLLISNSNYEVESKNKSQPVEEFVFENGISNSSIKLQYQYKVLYNNTLSFGSEYNYSQVRPGKLTPGGESVFEFSEISSQQSHALDLYIQDDWDITKRLAINGGLRVSNFFRVGTDQIYLFSEENTLGQPDVVSTNTYDNSELISQFSGLEPRVSLRYLFTANNSLKASYYRSYQYLHLVSNTVSATPQDYYLASGPNLSPQSANQYAVGFFQNLSNNVYEVSAEVYYKTIQNTIDFIEGAEVIGNEQIEGSLIQGAGRAYGLEVLLKKNKGKFNGWLSYTYSRSLKKLDGTLDREVINSGNYYGSNFDKPHDLTLVASVELAPRVILSTNFSYSTGRPITIPITKYSYDKTTAVLVYSDRNEYRIPDYHRLDLSITIKESLKKTKLIHGEWVLSVYNLYSRDNVYSIFFEETGKAKQLSILGSVFPSLTYNFYINK